MSFFRVQSQHHLANGPTSCKVSLTKMSRRKTAQVQHGLRVVLGTQLLGELGADIGDRLDLLWGDRADAGKVLLLKSKRGVAVKLTRECKSDTGYLTFVNIARNPIPGNQGATWLLASERRPAVQAEWEAREGGIVVTLPREWWRVEDSPGKQTLQRITAIPMPNGGTGQKVVLA